MKSIKMNYTAISILLFIGFVCACSSNTSATSAQSKNNAAATDETDAGNKTAADDETDAGDDMISRTELTEGICAGD